MYICIVVHVCAYMQVFPVKCVVAMPCLVLSSNQVDFGMCLVGHTYSANVEVINTSSSDTAWTASVSAGMCTCVCVCVCALWRMDECEIMAGSYAAWERVRFGNTIEPL